MKLIPFCLLLAVILLLGKVVDIYTPIVILIGTALPIQLVIYSFLKLRALRSMREVISTVFARLSLAVGFSILVAIGIIAISAEVFLLRDFVPPSNSWSMITLGFLMGIMGPVFHTMKLRTKQREQDAASNGG